MAEHTYTELLIERQQLHIFDAAPESFGKFLLHLINDEKPVVIRLTEGDPRPFTNDNENNWNRRGNGS